MAEPTSTTAALASVFAAGGLATLVPVIDGNALIGAFAGAALVALSSKDHHVLRRLAYGLISLIVGYLTAPDVTNLSPIRQTGVAAFLVAATAVAVVQIGIEKWRALDIAAVLALFRKGA